MFVIRKRSNFPCCIRHLKDLKGISIGKCIKDKSGETNWGQDSAAHCHPNHGDLHMGWMCLRYKYLLKERLTLFHEVAHLIANKCRSYAAHGDKWRKAVIEIGGTYLPYISGNGRYTAWDYSPRKERTQNARNEVDRVFMEMINK